MSYEFPGQQGVPYAIASALANMYVTGLVASTATDLTSSKANAVILNAALLAAYRRGGGNVFIPASGLYYICAANPATADRILSIYSNVTLDSVPGAQLIGHSASEAPCIPLLVNSNYRSTLSVVSSATCSVSAAPYIATVTANITAHGMAVGDYVLIKGDTTGYYSGVWKVSAVPSTNQLQWLMYGFSAAPAMAGTVIMYPADANFAVGPNITLNASLNTNTSGYLGELGKMCAIFNKCADYKIQGSFIRAAKYGIYYCNSTRAVFDLGTPQGPSSAIQAGGPVSMIRMKGIFALQGDDIFPLITDNYNYTFYDLRDSDAGSYAACTKSSDGDITDVLIEDLQIQNGGSRTVALFANTGYSIKRVTIKGTQIASSLAGIYAAIGAETGQTGNFEDIVFDGYYGPLGANPLLFIGPDSGATINYKNVTVRNAGARGAAVGGTPTAFSGAGLITFGTSTINGDGLTIDGIDVDADLTNAPSSGCALVSVGGGAGIHTLKNNRLTNATMRGAGTTRGISAVTLNANAAVENFHLVNVSVRGNSSCLVNDGSTQAGTTTIALTSCFADQGAATNGQSGVISAGGRSMIVEMMGVVLPNALSGAFYVYGGTSKTFDVRMAGVKCSHRLFRNDGTANVFNLRSMGGNSSDNFGKNSGVMLQNTGSWTMNLLDNCADIGVDADLIARQDGTIFYNTKSSLGTLAAAGLVTGQGTAANSWRLMGDPTKQY